MPKPSNKCEFCDWWKRLPIGEPQDKGTCHSESPHPWPMCGGREGAPLPVVVWPVTESNEFCGRFQADSGYGDES